MADHNDPNAVNSIFSDIDVSAADLYRLALGPAIGDHVLRLEAEGPGVEAFAFTFGT